MKPVIAFVIIIMISMALASGLVIYHKEQTNDINNQNAQQTKIGKGIDHYLNLTESTESSDMP